jgi:hypothetical protein
VLGYTIVTFEDSGRTSRVLPFRHDTNRMMAEIVDDLSTARAAFVRVAETYLHECGHQCGLIHDTGAPDCANAITLNIAKLMDPGGSLRRALTRNQWCMIRTSCYVAGDDLDAFLQAPELPDSGTHP